MKTTARSRVRKGVREGGQYSAELRSEPGEVRLVQPASPRQLTHGLRGMEERYPGLLIDAQPSPYDRTAVRLGFLSVDEGAHLAPAMLELKELVEQSGFDSLEVTDAEEAFPDMEQDEAEALLDEVGLKAGRWEVPRKPEPTLSLVPEPDAEPVAPPAPEPEPAAEPEPVVPQVRKRKPSRVKPAPVVASEPEPDLPAPENEDDLDGLDMRREPDTEPAATPAPISSPVEFTPENYDGSVPVPADWIAASAAGLTDPELRQSLSREDLATSIGGFVAKRAYHLAGTTPEQVATGWEWRSTVLQKEVDAELKAGIFNYSSRSKEAQDMANGRDPETLKGMRKLSDGYLSALKEIRPMGGKVEFHEESQPSAMKLVSEASQYFPADWLQDFNTGNPLIAKKTSDRARYRNNFYQTGKKDRVGRYFMPGGIGDRKDDLYSSYKLAEDQTLPPHLAGQEGAIYEETRYENHLVDSGRYKKTKDGAPYGGGWVKHNHEGREYWRRPRQKKVADTSELLSEITVGGKRKQQMADMTQDLDVAVHEMTHRHEYNVDGLYKLEDEFRTRRTTSEDGTRHKVERISPPTTEDLLDPGWRKRKTSKEVCRPDHFADRYMGRIYDHDATEIMSTGMESVFTGTFGGLAGVGGYHADPDMRDFVLGTLAILPGGKGATKSR